MPNDRKPCFHCDIKDLIVTNGAKFTTQQIGEGLLLALAEHMSLNVNYRTDLECKIFAVMELSRALDIALEMKNSGEKIVTVNRGYMT